MMCAIHAARRNSRVLLLGARGPNLGRKSLSPAGGVATSPTFIPARKTFSPPTRTSPKVLSPASHPRTSSPWSSNTNIAFHEKTLGQLFCDRSAQDIVNMLLHELTEAGATLRTGTQIVAIVKDGEDFLLDTNSVRLRAAAVVVATGGLSIPKMGATAFGYELAQQFGINVIATRPALVPLTFGPEDCDRWCDLSGLSTEVIASAGRQHFREKLLITHRGISGPAILQISSYWRPGQSIQLDLAPGADLLQPLLQKDAVRDRPNALWAIRDALPTRLAERWLTLFPPSKWTNHGLAEAERALHAWSVTPAGTEGYDKAEVTAGGIDTAELDSTTMQSKRVPGLFFIGEVVDVTGWLGGYNFQWAWASGAAAGRSL